MNVIAKHMLSCKRIYIYIFEWKQSPLGKSVSNAIQTDTRIIWVWLMKHTQDKDPAAIQRNDELVTPHNPIYPNDKYGYW